MKNREINFYIQFFFVMKSLKEKDVENEMAKQRLRVSFPREVVNEEESVQWGNRIYGDMWVAKICCF